MVLAVRLEFSSTVPTRHQRVGAIPSPLWLVIVPSMNNQLPSLSVISCIWSLLDCEFFCRFLLWTRAPFPALESLPRVSLRRMEWNSRTRACLHLFKPFSFSMITRITTPESQWPFVSKRSRIIPAMRMWIIYYFFPHPWWSGLRMHNFRSRQGLKVAFTFIPSLILNRPRYQRLCNLIISNKRRHRQKGKLISCCEFCRLQFFKGCHYSQSCHDVSSALFSTDVLACAYN